MNAIVIRDIQSFSKYPEYITERLRVEIPKSLNVLLGYYLDCFHNPWPLFNHRVRDSMFKLLWNFNISILKYEIQLVWDMYIEVVNQFESLDDFHGSVKLVFLENNKLIFTYNLTNNEQTSETIKDRNLIPSQR